MRGIDTASARALRMPVPRVQDDIPATLHVVASVRAPCPTRPLAAPRTYVKRAIQNRRRQTKARK
eukprot:5452727-Prymnesium_polylepis.1